VVKLRIDSRYRCLALEELKALAEIAGANESSIVARGDFVEVSSDIGLGILCRATMVRGVEGVDFVRYVKNRGPRLISKGSTSLPPLVARTMVNLARVKEGSVVYEPFCGRGSIALEAAMVGARVYCSDVDPLASSSCLRNMPANAEVHVLVSDARMPPFKPKAFNAIITDLPYGKLSACKHDVENLYWNFALTSSELVKRGGYAVLAYPNYVIGLRETLEDLGFEVVNECPMYIHSGLYRIIGIYRRS